MATTLCENKGIERVGRDEHVSRSDKGPSTKDVR